MGIPSPDRRRDSGSRRLRGGGLNAGVVGPSYQSSQVGVFIKPPEVGLELAMALDIWRCQGKRSNKWTGTELRQSSKYGSL